MTTVKIDIPDQQATQLAKRAAAHGLSIEDYFRRLVENEDRASLEPELTGHPHPASVSGRVSVVEQMRRLRARIKPDPEGWTVKDYVDHGRR